MASTVRPIPWLLALVACLAATVPAMWYRISLRPVAEARQHAIIITVKRGQGAAAIGRLLSQKGLIRSSRAFNILARTTALAGRLQAGTYLLSPAETPMAILTKLSEGRVAETKVTVPEGLTSREIGALLQGHHSIRSAERFLRFVGREGIEGRLFPETYRIPLGASEGSVATMMVKRFEKQVSAALGEETLVREDFRDILILASIVEREAKLEVDRPLVASVFVNRLAAGRKLESCATVEYVLGHNKERLLYEDLKVKSPYNTYMNKGLPPGPICNPGLASIKAAASPSKTAYLYFVVGADGLHHVFSKDFGSHVSAAQQRRRVVK